MARGVTSNDVSHFKQATAPLHRSLSSRRVFAVAVSIFVAALINAGLGTLLLAPLPAYSAEADRLEARIKQHVKVPDGYRLRLFAAGLPRARLMIETPRGDLIVSTRADKVYLVTNDANKDGRADDVRVLLAGLDLPHGVLLDDDWLYVAEQGRVSRVRFDAAKRAVVGSLEPVLTGLPSDGGHVTRTLKKGPDGWFYLSVGSSCNVCVERNPWRAALLRFQPGTTPEVFASGLRNTVGFDWQPVTGTLFGVDNGRDWLGDDLPPEEVNRIEQGGFYGWPYRYGQNRPDPQYGDQFHGKAIPPAFEMRAHTAPLSIRFLRHQTDPAMADTALVAQHGSWNRSTKDGYKVIALHIGDDGAIRKSDFLTGFLSNGRVLGRPVDTLERNDGTILIADDDNGAIWALDRAPD